MSKTPTKFDETLWKNQGNLLEATAVPQGASFELRQLGVSLMNQLRQQLSVGLACGTPLTSREVALVVQHVGSLVITEESFGSLNDSSRKRLTTMPGNGMRTLGLKAFLEGDRIVRDWAAKHRAGHVGRAKDAAEELRIYRSLARLALSSAMRETQPAEEPPEVKTPPAGDLKDTLWVRAWTAGGAALAQRWAYRAAGYRTAIRQLVSVKAIQELGVSLLEQLRIVFDARLDVKLSDRELELLVRKTTYIVLSDPPMSILEESCREKVRTQLTAPLTASVLGELLCLDRQVQEWVGEHMNDVAEKTSTNLRELRREVARMAMRQAAKAKRLSQVAHEEIGESRVNPAALAKVKFTPPTEQVRVYDGSRDSMEQILAEYVGCEITQDNVREIAGRLQADGAPMMTATQALATEEKRYRDIAKTARYGIRYGMTQENLQRMLQTKHGPGAYELYTQPNRNGDMYAADKQLREFAAMEAAMLKYPNIPGAEAILGLGFQSLKSSTEAPQKPTPENNNTMSNYVPSFAQKPLATATFVFGHEVSSLSEQETISNISAIKSQIANLDGIADGSRRLQQRKSSLEAAVDVLVAHLDTFADPEVTDVKSTRVNSDGSAHADRNPDAE